ncbi:MAG TPA: DinB family protein [Acidimicrobiales bacterium]|nr:DinB family protein [Acidimicrobiales bacterium]
MLKKTRDIPRRQRRFVEIDLSRSRFHNVDLTDSRIRGAILTHVEIDGDIDGLTVNGVEIAPLVRAELDRRFPEHEWIRSSDPDWLAEAWKAIDRRWDEAIAAVAALPEDAAHRSVDQEWSFVETLRHLVFVTDAWVRRPVMGGEGHYWTAGLPATDFPPLLVEACALDLTAEPTLSEVLEARRLRVELLGEVLSSLSAADLPRSCSANPSPGYPIDTSKLTIKRCLRVVLREEWEHHRIAVRDLARLESGGARD